jgi:hypothetical protein
MEINISDGICWIKESTQIKSVSIIIPALNEEQGIALTIQAIPRAELEKMGYQTQILVVDNGSTDRTSELAKEAGADVIREPRRGYGFAYKTGFANARGDIIATGDADLTYPMEDIPKLIKMLEKENLDFITTNRYPFMNKQAMSLQHRFGNAVLTYCCRALFKLDINDSQSGMWVFKRDIFKQTKLRFNTMALSEELKIEACHFANCKWKEVPIEYRARMGKVKLKTWRDGIDNLISLFSKRFMR